MEFLLDIFIAAISFFALLVAMASICYRYITQRPYLEISKDKKEIDHPGITQPLKLEFKNVGLSPLKISHTKTNNVIEIEPESFCLFPNEAQKYKLKIKSEYIEKEKLKEGILKKEKFEETFSYQWAGNITRFMKILYCVKIIPEKYDTTVEFKIDSRQNTWKMSRIKSAD